ncbi:MAG: hypothetical protein BAJATHORv1_20497 [Candidatus Thorarchaeota archaeon]|nr:MAG: hypothetical protein BAJATHORv1_20497 [Candidatus Thorarchaeota archaeon]
MLNAIKYHEKGYDVLVILECSSPKLLIEIVNGTIKMPLFYRAKNWSY